MNKIIKLVLFIICFAFVVSYIIYETGYYEYKLNNQTIFTKEQMEQFEKDVNEGKDVELTDYIKDTNIDYSTNLTDATVKVNNKVSSYFKKSIELVFKQINRLVQE